jgi:hypothetical protein
MRRSFLHLLAVVGLLLLALTAAAQQQQDVAKAHADWGVSMAQVRLPKEGCFRSAYPAKQWSEVTCVTPPPYPMVPPRGPRPLVVGGGNDIAAEAPSGTITTASGSFDSATNVTSEAGQINAVGPQVPNAYTYQLNTNVFFNSPACAGASDPTQCRSWEQFIFDNDGTSGSTYIQYWLIRWNNPCPGGWASYPYPTASDTSCYRNTTAATPVPNQPINSANIIASSLSGTATAASDSVTFTAGGVAYARSGNNFSTISAGWTQAEFEIVGDAGGGQANFNAGAAYVSRTKIFYGGTAPPNCVVGAFTGETNNLNFATPAPAPSAPGPALIFSESTAGTAVADCADATSVGDTHLTTVKSLFYDFQAAGDFTVAQRAPNFEVQARQVSGAPTWPNADVNKAIATRMGKTTVALCLAPERLFVDGKETQIGDKVLEVPGGVDITRRADHYYITSPDGDSVIATVHGAPGWIDVAVGFGRWPANVKGLLANANNNINQIAASDGTVLTAAFPFADLYHHYADSWRVSPRASLLSACGEATDLRAPTDTFYATDLDPQVRERSRAVCATAGVNVPAFLDACTVDVTMIGNPEAAKVFLTMPAPAAVGQITKPGGGKFSILQGNYPLWLLLLLIIIVVVVWLFLKK